MRLRSAEASPSAVFDKMGKNATRKAQASTAVGASRYIKSKGAIATMGVTCKMIAKGKSERSAHFHCVKRIARPAPPQTAAASAPKVVLSVSQGRKEDRPVGNQRCANERWRGQHIRRNGLQTDIGFPPSQQRCKRNRGRRVAYGPLRQSHCTLPICAGAVEQRANL